MVECQDIANIHRMTTSETFDIPAENRTEHINSKTESCITDPGKIERLLLLHHCFSIFFLLHNPTIAGVPK